MSQWVPLHRLPLGHLKMIIRTFLDVFPETTVWYKYTPDFLVLVGTIHEQSIDHRDWVARTRLPAVDRELAMDDMDTWTLLDSFFMGPEAAREFAGKGPLHTDDRPRLEFFGSDLGGMMTTQSENIKTMLPYREHVYDYLINFSSVAERSQVRARLETYFLATQKLIEGQAVFALQRYEQAAALYEEAARLNPNDPTIAYHAKVVQERGISDIGAELATVIGGLRASLRDNPDDVATLTQLALAYRNAGEIDRSIERYERAVALAPDNVQIYLQLAETYQHNGDLSRAIFTWERAASLAPDQIVILGSLATAYGQAGDPDGVIRTTRRILRLDPDHALAHRTLGSAYLDKGELQEAAHALQRAITSDPVPSVAAEAWTELGSAYGQMGRFPEAVGAYEEALRIDPLVQGARQGLRQAQELVP